MPSSEIVDHIRAHPDYADKTAIEVLSALEDAFPSADADDFAAALLAAGEPFAKFASEIKEFVAAREHDFPDPDQM